MASEWETTHLGNSVTHQKGFAFKSADYRPSGHPIVRVSNFTDRSIDLAECSYLDHEAVQQYDAFKLRHRDTVIATVGSWPANPASVVGKTICVPEKAEAALLNQNAVRLRSKPGLDQRFLFYLLKQPDFQAYIVGTAQGSASQASITLNDIFGFEFQRPPLAEQKAIASILGALDDKIELNRRMNATLEGMARALFQSWFVDFDPVRAKLDGRKPEGMDKATAALFPDAFEDSSIGPVPKGWKVERFDAHITADRGLSYKGEGLREDRTGLPMHNLNSIYEGGGYKHEGIKYYQGEYREKHLLAPGDMIVTNTEQGFDHMLIGHAAIVPECFGSKGIYSHHIYRIRHKPASPLRPHYLVKLFNNRRWHYWISGFSNGTTINMLPMDALEMPMLVVPPVEPVKKFTALAEASHIQTEANLHESRTLATLRDTLLPKLLSGELSVASIPKVKA